MVTLQSRLPEVAILFPCLGVVPDFKRILLVPMSLSGLVHISELFLRYTYESRLHANTSWSILASLPTCGMLTFRERTLGLNDRCSSDNAADHGDEMVHTVAEMNTDVIPWLHAVLLHAGGESLQPQKELGPC